MGTKDTKKQKETAFSRDGAEKAKVILANQLFNTPEERLCEYTRLPRRAILSLVRMEVREAQLDLKRTIPLSKILRLSLYRHLRSLDGWHFRSGLILAQEQAMAEAEKKEEEIEL